MILLCSALARHAWSAGLVLGSPEQQWYIVEKGQQRATNVMEVLEHLSYEEKERQLGPLSLEKRRLRGILPM